MDVNRPTKLWKPWEENVLGKIKLTLVAILGRVVQHWYQLTKLFKHSKQVDNIGLLIFEKKLKISSVISDDVDQRTVTLNNNEY